MFFCIANAALPSAAVGGPIGTGRSRLKGLWLADLRVCVGNHGSRVYAVGGFIMSAFEVQG